MNKRYKETEILDSVENYPPDCKTEDCKRCYKCYSIYVSDKLSDELEED